MSAATPLLIQGTAKEGTQSKGGPEAVNLAAEMEGTTAKKRKSPPRPSGDDEHHSSTYAKKIAATTISVPALSPYNSRMKELERFRKEASSSSAGSAAGSDEHVIWTLSGDLLEKAGLDVDDYDTEDLPPDDRKRAYDSISSSDIDRHLWSVIVPRSVVDLQNELENDILFADPRNSRGDGMLCLNTYSSWCMYPVINKQLSAATREVNKATKEVKAAEDAGRTPASGVAAGALRRVLATVMAADGCDHWRQDTESPEDCDKIAKKVSKLLKDVLWFEDTELGLVDPYSRRSLLAKFADMSEDWKLGGAVSVKIQAKSAKNGNGMGRSNGAAAAQPAAKKSKIVSVTAAAASASASSSSSGAISGLDAYLSGIDDKLKKRMKTVLQIKISDIAKPSRSALVVLSGATDMKKMNQLCAFVTGHDKTYQYHSQRGTCLKGSRIELRLGDNSRTWLAEKGAVKRATAAGATLCVDKNLKIVQVFQGLTTGSDSGITYDSEEAKRLATTPESVVWVSPDEKRYELTVQTIAPAKVEVGKPLPLPRIVSHAAVEDYEYHPQARTGFGKGLHGSNWTIRGDRKGPGLIILGGCTQAELRKRHSQMSATPICNEDGTWPRGILNCWTEENVASAGPPSK